VKNSILGRFEVGHALADGIWSDRRSVVYQNEGNLLLLSLLLPNARTILDVGCGAGDNARLIRKLNENIEIIGITLSAEEAKHARRHMTAVHVIDLDVSDLSFLGERRFDAIIFSHVLEHVKDPQRILSLSARQHLRVGGQMLIAVPNVLYYKTRLQFLAGHFEYEESGILDRTHLHFFTWDTADRYLVDTVKELKLAYKVAEGSAPLWVLRRWLLPVALSTKIDAYLVRLFPNLFGWQIVMSVSRIEEH
jgi:2-polyprenyl-3-methyl-5-hydroxy-6-metoxy-1,4-benzoquinol methylase